MHLLQMLYLQEAHHYMHVLPTTSGIYTWHVLSINPAGSQTCHLTVHMKGRLPTIILQQCKYNIITQTFMNPSIVFGHSNTQCLAYTKFSLPPPFNFPPSSSLQFPSLLLPSIFLPLTPFNFPPFLSSSHQFPLPPLPFLSSPFLPLFPFTLPALALIL